MINASLTRLIALLGLSAPAALIPTTASAQTEICGDVLAEEPGSPCKALWLLCDAFGGDSLGDQTCTDPSCKKQ